ncbi:MAG: hypothetical protein JNK87_17340, partial [Bryobacterales bacterium]|nr:hypothetical protein [Bryobacterales bacterium]
PGIAGIGLGIGLLLGGGILAGGAAKRQQRRRQAAEVAIGPHHVRLQQEITNWRASGIRLKKVTVEEDPARLVFHLRRPRAKADERLEVPVPSGRRAEAEELSKRFAADGAA